MSLEAVIQENTNTMRELIAVWSKLNKQAIAIDQSAAVDTVVAAGTPVVAKPEKVAKAETKTTKTETKASEPETKPVEAKTQPAAADAPAIAIADVNAAIIALAKAKGRDAAVAVLGTFGVAKAPELKAEQYADVVAAAKKAMA
jgi:hypothetical protein